MNYEESDSFKEQIEANTRHRKMVMLSIVLCAMLIAFLFIMILMLKEIDAKTMKVFINGKQVNFSSKFISEVGQNEKYLNIKEFSKLLGDDYKYTIGEYKKYNEDPNSGYVQNSFEVVAFTADSDMFSKYIEINPAAKTFGEYKIATLNANGYSEDFYIEKPVKVINDELYASVDVIKDMLNVKIDWSKEFRLRITTLEQSLVDAGKKMPAGYSTISGYYENFRALNDGYIILTNGGEKDSATALTGVYDVNTKDMIAGPKYKKVQYLQNVKQFIVTAEDNTVGLLNSSGNIIFPVEEYTSISLMDSREKFYLVEKERQYGILSAKNEKRQEIAYCEYDKIGLDDVSNFAMDNITNRYLLFGECIPFYRETSEEGVFKYGLLNKDGEVILDNEYDSLGYESLEKTTNATRARSTLLIPESVGIRGIIVRLGDYYGIYDVDKEKLVLPAVFSKIYVAVKDGISEYYIEYNGQQIVLRDFLIENNIIPASSKKLVAPEPELEEDTSEDKAALNTIEEELNTLIVDTNTTVTNEVQ